MCSGAIAAGGQQIARCLQCRIADWSPYAGASPLLKLVRVGTLDDADQVAPDIHIFTRSKQPWVLIAPDKPAVPEYYDRDQHRSAASLARRQRLSPQTKAWQVSQHRSKP